MQPQKTESVFIHPSSCYLVLVNKDVAQPPGYECQEIRAKQWKLNSQRKQYINIKLDKLHHLQHEADHRVD